MRMLGSNPLAGMVCIYERVSYILNLRLTPACHRPDCAPPLPQCHGACCADNGGTCPSSGCPANALGSPPQANCKIIAPNNPTFPLTITTNGQCAVADPSGPGSGVSYFAFCDTSVYGTPLTSAYK